MTNVAVRCSVTHTIDNVLWMGLLFLWRASGTLVLVCCFITLHRAALVQGYEDFVPSARGGCGSMGACTALRWTLE